MERHESEHAQRDGRQPPRRAVILAGWITLSLGLAWSTFFQTGVWRSEQTLWTHAHQVEPLAPRPVIGLAWVAIDHQDYGAALGLLETAARLTDQQPPKERAWADDAIATTTATVHLATGHLRAAASLMAHAPWDSERTALCHRYASVCALADSPSSP